MIRRVYSITGFDCAACAEKSERHLQKDSRISSARIDFVGERLYVEFKSEEVLPEVLKQVIAEVESDPIEITAVNEAKKSKDRKPLILTLRIAYCVLIFFLCGFLFKDLYWLRFSLYLSALLLIEYDILWKVVQNVAHLRNPLDEYLLISLASSGAFVLACLKMAEKGEARAFGNDVFQMEEHFEAVLVALLWQVGELLQTIAVRRSTRAIEKAVDSRVEEALLLEHGSLRRVAASSLHVGDVCRVNEAMAIPVDGEVVEGSGYCDTSSLTGESVPVALEKGSPVYSGTMLVSGEVLVEAKKDYENSSSARILSLIHESLEKKGKAERFITKFARVYTPVIFLVALVYIVLAGFLGLSWRSAVYSGLEIMVISCPCALVISVPLAYFAAMGLSSKNGIVVKSACHLDSLTSFKTVITDKTGTLTKGKFSIAEIAVEEGIEEIHFRTLLASLESSLSHPIAKAVVEGLGVEVSAPSSVTTLPGLGVQGEIHGKTYYAGNAKLAKAHGYKAVERFEGVVIYLFDEQVLYGHVALEDELKPTSIKAVEALRKQGVSVNIYSGDAERNVAKTAEMLHVDSYRAELLPDEKLSLLEETKEKSQAPVCFLGDGVNDAPSLARADIGVAMGGLGSDLAVEEADVILLRDDPYSLVEARSIAKKNRSVIVVNIAFALAVKVAVMVLAMVLGESLPMEVAVLADTGVSVLCTLNSLLLLRRKP